MSAANFEKAALAIAETQKVQHVYVTVEPDIKLGSDGNAHDAFINGDFKVTAGEPVELTIYNYDDMPHSMTATKLGLNVQAIGSKKEGTPGVTTVSFTPKTAGTYDWKCVDPCDLDQKQWAMSQKGFMMGKITVLPPESKTQYVSLVVNGRYVLGSDGNKHDAFTPSDFTVNAGTPVELTVYNFDDMPHSVTAGKLDLNQQAKGSKKDGVPGVTTITFTPKEPGTYDWQCIDPCDMDQKGWAMGQEGFMKGHTIVK